MAISYLVVVAGVVVDQTLSPQQFYADSTPIRVSRSEAVKVRLVVYKSDGTRQDLSEVGLGVFLGVKPRFPRGVAALFTVQADLVDAANGVCEVELTSALIATLDPDSYEWDALIVDGEGTPTRIVLLSSLTVDDGVALPGAAVVPPAETPLGTAVRRIVYTVTADDVAAGGQDLSVPISPAAANADYGAVANVATTTVAGAVFAMCPAGTGDRTTSTVRVLVSAALSAGDTVEVFLTR